MNVKKNEQADNKPTYITVVRQIRVGGKAMVNEFTKFDEQVNAKIAEGYRPCGNLVVDHCTESCMDVVQAMMLQGPTDVKV